jgi:hypothetical protein
LFKYRRRPGSLSTNAWYGPGHVPLTRYRVEKHKALYRTHLIDVLLHQDVETATLLRQNDEKERYLASELEPAVASRREELALLRSRLGSLEPRDTPLEPSRTRDLEAALDAAAAEVMALRTSMSWRITSPLRTLYGWWLRQRRAE